MANPESSGAAGGSQSSTTASGGAGVSALAEQSGTTTPTRFSRSASNNRPKRVEGVYPMRYTTYYQFSSSDIRSIGVAQAATTFFAAAGTFSMSYFFDIGKDIAVMDSSQLGVNYLQNVANLCLTAWAVFWFIAVVAFIWQGVELRRIKAEHGEATYSAKVKTWWDARDQS